MSRTFAHKPNAKLNYKPKRPNTLGICNCVQCRYGRRGKKSPDVMRVKSRQRNWWNNKPLIRGAYTD